MKQSKDGFEPMNGKEDVYQVTISAVRARANVANNWRSRRASWLEPLVQKGLAKRIEVVAQTRVVLWLGSPSVTELGFCLHHVYGLPYLPPSALKGLASKALWRAADPSATWKNPPSQVLDLFGEGGDKGHEGRVTFLDGIPLGDASGNITLQVDVMTPHHATYYTGGGQPHDCEGPNPLPFLCIPPGQRFEIGLVYTRGSSTGPRGSDHWLSEAERWLLTGLAEMGLGAKTTSGYGILVRSATGSSGTTPPASPPANADSPSPSTGSPAAKAAPDTVIATIVSTDRKSAEGQARTDDGHILKFKCPGLGKLGYYRQDWTKAHGQRFVFEKQGNDYVPVRKEG